MALKRELGSLQVFSIATGAAISSGLFVLPGILFLQIGSGSGLVLAYLLASLLAIPAVMSKAELATAMPKAGGDYFFIDRSLGPGFGMAGGIAAWASLSLKSAFALLGMGAFATFLWPGQITQFHIKAIACGFCLVFMVVNLIGVRQVGRVQVVLVFFLLAVGLLYGFGGLRSIDTARFSPILPKGGFNRLFGAVAMVFVSFGGLTKAATLGEEVKKPRRDLIVGMFMSHLVVSILYVCAVVTTVGILAPDMLKGSLIPLSHGGRALWGWPGAVVLSVAAVCAFLTTANGGLLASSRTIMAMSRDGHLPSSLGVVNEKTGTPVAAILFSTLFMIVVIVSLDLVLFVKAASAMKILLFMFAMLSVVVMRESRIPSYAPTWRCPFYPWVQVAGIAFYFFLLVELGSVPLLIAAGILGGGYLWYILFVKVHTNRESALAHLASRVAAADFPEHDLEAELSEIVRHRDKVVADRFDRLIEESPVLDLPGPLGKDEMFEAAARELAVSFGLPADEIRGLLVEREDLSSTVIRDGVAIPHCFSERFDLFRLLLVRSNNGITFSEEEEPVHAVFILLGPERERKFYLQALMAIAEIAQDSSFDKKWRSARSVEGLREFILRAERRREQQIEGPEE